MFAWAENFPATPAISVAVDFWTTIKSLQVVETWPAPYGISKRVNRLRPSAATPEMSCPSHFRPTTDHSFRARVTHLPNSGIFERVFANKRSPVMKVTLTQSRFSPTVTHLQLVPMTRLVASLTFAPTKSWRCIPTTISFAASLRSLSPNREGFF